MSGYYRIFPYYFVNWCFWILPAAFQLCFLENRHWTVAGRLKIHPPAAPSIPLGKKIGNFYYFSGRQEYRSDPVGTHQSLLLWPLPRSEKGAAGNPRIFRVSYNNFLLHPVHLQSIYNRIYYSMILELCEKN